MAWPYDTFLETISAGVTTAKKTFADGIQQAINRLFSGAYRVWKLEVNAAGGPSTNAGSNEIYALGKIVTASDLYARRLRATGNSLVVGDFDFPTGNFGASATVSNVSGNDTHFRFQVNAAGAGVAAPGSVRLTFKDGAYPTAPRAIGVLRAVDNNADFAFGVQVDCTTTTAVLTWWGTPTAGRSYYFDVFVIG